MLACPVPRQAAIRQDLPTAPTPADNWPEFRPQYRARYAHSGTCCHRQMSIPKQVWPNMATATPLGLPGPRQRRSSTPGCPSWTPSHPPPASVFPRARHGRSLPRCGVLTFRHLRGIGSLTGNLEGSYFLALWSQAHMPSCNRQVTSTSIRMARPGPATAPAVTHRYKRAHCLWLEQFQIADSARVTFPPSE
jgi:hypothetical protein